MLAALRGPVHVLDLAGRRDGVVGFGALLTAGLKAALPDKVGPI